MKSRTDAIEEINSGGAWTDITIPSASSEFITASFTNCKMNNKMASISGTVYIHKNFSGTDAVSTVYPVPKVNTSIPLTGSYFILFETNGTIFAFGSYTDTSYSGSTYSFTDVTYYLA